MLESITTALDELSGLKQTKEALQKTGEQVFRDYISDKKEWTVGDIQMFFLSKCRTGEFIHILEVTENDFFAAMKDGRIKGKVKNTLSFLLECFIHKRHACFGKRNKASKEIFSLNIVFVNTL